MLATEALLESLPVAAGGEHKHEIRLPQLLERHSSCEREELDLNDLMHDSFVFHHNGRRRKAKTLADSDTISTCANSSFTSSLMLERSTSHGNPASSLPLRKCVRFDLSCGDGEPFCEEFEPKDGCITDEERVATWWQPMEFQLFRRYCRRAAEIARKSKDYPDKFARVYDACSSKNNVGDGLSAEFSDVSRVSVRGLEAIVFPALVQARKLVVKGVVQTQQKLAADSSMGFEERAKILSSTSRCLTARSRVLARVFGAGDEEVAKDCYYSMDQNEGRAEC